MSIADFYAVVGAVVVGNALSGLWVYAAFHAVKAERKTGRGNAPMWACACMIPAPAAVFISWVLLG